MPAPFSMAAIPPQVLMALGQAFGVATPEGMTDAAHYDQALFHLMSHWGGQPLDEDAKLPHLALAMKHTALMMGLAPSVNSTMQLALSQGTAFNMSSVAPPQSPEPEQPPQLPEPTQPEQPKPKMTGDGWVILEYEPGVHLSSEQARERAGLGKPAMAKLLQAGEFVRPAGVIQMGNGQKPKVYLAEDVDKWMALRGGKSNRGMQSDESKAKRASTMDKVNELPIIDYAQVRYGNYWNTPKVIEEIGCSDSHLFNMRAKGRFPQPDARSRDEHSGSGMYSIVWQAEVVKNWINTSHDTTAFQARKRRAARAGTADNSAEPEPSPLASAPLTTRGRELASPEDLAKLTAAPVAKVKMPGATGWMNLREVAAFLSTTETGVERMVREKRFPNPARINGKFKTKEWGARQVAKWKRENMDSAALTAS